MAIEQGDTVIKQIMVDDKPHEISAKYLDGYTFNNVKSEINNELISRLQGTSESSVPYDPFIKLNWRPGDSNFNDNMNALCPEVTVTPYNNADGTVGYRETYKSNKKIGHFRSYSDTGISCLDINVDVLSWANPGVNEIFMQTVSGPVTLKDSNKNLYWVNSVPGSGPGHYYRLSKRAHGAGNETRTWSEWKPVNNSYIEPLQSKVHHQLTPPYYYSNPNLDIAAGGNNIYCYGYVGTLKNINVNGDYILIDSISVYIREDGDNRNIDTPVWCRLLKYVNNTWVTVYQSTESRKIRGIAPETLFSFKMKAIDDTNDANKLIRRNDKIAIVYVDSADAEVLSGVQLGFKSIIKPGGLENKLANNSTGRHDWCPAFVIGYLSTDTEQTFDGDIHIKNKTTITTNIDAGELKVRHYGTEKGFIIRTNNKGANVNANIFPLEILTTNNNESYQYNFPKQNGDVVVYKNVIYNELVGLKNSSNLVPGGVYRITDYMTYTSAASTSSAGHSFDILVVALSNNKLSENAKACLHDGDTYFSTNGAKLESWEIKYCIDNDATRFQWINGTSTSRRGVIYYMKDEWGNEAPYDFKNILFKKSGVNYYTFSLNDGSIKDATVTTKNVYNNKILPLYDLGDQNMILNYNTFLINDEHLCMSNYIGTHCKNNHFGSNCICNTLKSYCTNNIFGDNCRYNEFGEYCTDNTLGNSCQSNVFGVYCTYNKFGSYILRCNIGNNCSMCKITNNGKDNGILLSYVKMIEFGDECSNVNLWTDNTNSNSYVQNYKITNGLSGSIKITGDNTRGRNYQTIISKNVYGDIVQFVLSADTVIKNIIYSDLKYLRDNNKLIPGQKYRITDYVTTTSQSNTQSAGHQFDIIVEALSENTLSEDAKAIQNENDGYFDEFNLEAWELKYCLDNDTSRFVWGNDNGKGVIYYMKDEFNNECPYDFKNIKFYHQEKDNRYLFTFSWVNENGDVEDLTLRQDLLSDEGIPYGTHDNIIKTYYYENLQQLNDVIFISSYLFDSGLFYGCYSNSFGYDCYHNSFGDNCCYNSFGDNCYYNSFGYNCYSNSFSNNCYSNSFGDNCYHNSFGNYCYFNDFGNDCYSNSFGNNCDSNSFGNNCDSNSFGNNCDSNSFGDNCDSNSFGNSCYRNTFLGDCGSNSFGNACFSNKFGNTCKYNSFDNRCYSNEFGDDCNSNSFGNDCNNNKFGNICKYNSFGNDSEFNTFGDECDSNNFGNNCSSNEFVKKCYSNTFTNGCESNKFGENCYGNTFGDYCKSNEFGSGCYSNSFNDKCVSNVFGSNCSCNIFDNYCVSNKFGETCKYNNFNSNSSNNEIGNNSNTNNFAQNCKYNKIGNNAMMISFGGSCGYNTLGNNYHSITFGSYCTYNIFTLHNYNEELIPKKDIPTLSSEEKVYGDVDNVNDYSPIDYVRYITFGDAVQYNVFYTRIATSTKNYLQMYNVDSYIINNRYIPDRLSKPIELKSGLQSSYITKISRNSSGSVKQYCEADLDGVAEIVVNNYNGQQVNIKPNKYYKFMNISTTLRINFEDESQDKMKNYMFEVRFAEGCNTLELPDGIEWANGVTPQICKEGGTYQISVINKLGIITEFN